MNIGTPYGLAFSSGVNAYLPLLSFSIAVRWFHLYSVAPQFAFVTQDWFMILMLILAIADLVADKIPGVDHVWDVIHTVMRPIAGALVAAVSSEQSGIGLLIPVVGGAALAGVTHATKATTRIVSTSTTAGLLNTILSVIEDVFVVLTTLLSLLVPVIMVAILVIFLLIFIFTAPRLIRAIKRRRQRTRVGTTI